MKADGITLSTVGAGGGANPFLEQLAKAGGGRFYAATDPASIPDIFLKETQQVSGQQIVEEPFFPIQTSSSPVLRGIDNGLPQLLGYNGTTAKAAAQTVLVSDRDDPVLAQWQYGLGRAVAWTSDSTGHWARNWVPVAGLLEVLQPDGRLDVPGRGERRHRGLVRGPRRAHLPAGREPEQRRLGPRLLLDDGGDGRAGPRAGDREPEPDRVGRLRGAGDEPRQRRLRGARDPAAGRRGAARPDARARRADGRRVPAPRGQRGAARRDPVRDGRPRGGRRRRTPGSTTSRPPASSPSCGRGCWCSRCCCGRSTSRSAACRSDAASSRTGDDGSAIASTGGGSPPAREQAEGLFAARERAGASGARSAIMREAAERPESSAAPGGAIATAFGRDRSRAGGPGARGPDARLRHRGAVDARPRRRALPRRRRHPMARRPRQGPARRRPGPRTPWRACARRSAARAAERPVRRTREAPVLASRRWHRHPSGAPAPAPPGASSPPGWPSSCSRCCSRPAGRSR